MPVGARSLSILFLTQTGLWILSLILIFFIFSIIKVCRRVYTFYLIDFRGWDDWSIIERAFKYSRYIYIYLFLGALSLAQLWFMADSNCSFIRAVAFTYYCVMCCGAIYLAEAFIFFFKVTIWSHEKHNTNRQLILDGLYIIRMVGFVVILQILLISILLI